MIVVERATYGRMSDAGRCIVVSRELNALKNDPRFLGCSKDVLDYMDGKCSGREECDVLVGEAELQRNNPCYPELAMYLAASYTCVVGELTGESYTYKSGKLVINSEANCNGQACQES